MRPLTVATFDLLREKAVIIRVTDLPDTTQVTINAAYFAEDVNGANRDPFCSDDDQSGVNVNIFAQFLDRLAANPSTFTET